MPHRAKTSWWEATLRGQRTGMLAGSLRKAALAGSWGYRAGLRGRDFAYQKGWLPVKRLPRPTVCVGNITVGGTGKTPLAIRLVSDLLARGSRPAVLLRGYKRERVMSRPLLVRDPKAIRAAVREAGDEAMELAVRLPGACVGVGADRYAVGRMILERYPVDCFVMDDGFQHHRLQRDFNLVALDAGDPWGGGRLLPAGTLREPPQALRRADLVILTRVASVAPDRLSVLRAEVSSLMRETSSLLESRHEPRNLISLASGKTYGLSNLKGKTVLAVSAIANPQSFEMSLTTLGAKLGAKLRMPDHGGRSREVWQWTSRHRQSGQWVIMTEKDAMRWTTDSIPPGLLADAFALRMDLAITTGEAVWQTFIENLASGRG